MSTTIPIEQVQENLKALIHDLAPGDEIVITEGQRPVARLVAEAPTSGTGLRPPPGLCKGMITIVSDDNEHVADFEDYVEQIAGNERRTGLGAPRPSPTADD